MFKLHTSYLCLMNRNSLPILGFQLCPGLQAEPCVFMSSSGGWCKVCGECWSAQWNLGCSLGKSSLVQNDLLEPSSRYQNSFIYELLLSFWLIRACGKPILQKCCDSGLKSCLGLFYRTLCLPKGWNDLHLSGLSLFVTVGTRVSLSRHIPLTTNSFIFIFTAWFSKAFELHLKMKCTS